MPWITTNVGSVIWLWSCEANYCDEQKKNLKLCTLISSSLQSKSTLDPEGLPGRPARHKLMQAFQELYKMTHIGLSWLLEIPSNSHFTMQFLTKVSQSVNTWVKREHSSRYSRESLRSKPNNTSKGVFFSERSSIVTELEQEYKVKPLPLVLEYSGVSQPAPDFWLVTS